MRTLQRGEWTRGEDRWKEELRLEQMEELGRVVQKMETYLGHREESMEWCLMQRVKEVMVCLRILQWLVWRCLCAWRGVCEEKEV